jgi:hypothetical protein
MKELLDQWKKSIVVPIHKRGDKIIVGYHYHQLHKISSNIFLLSLSLYKDEIVRDHQCEFRRNRSNTDHVSYVCQTTKKMGIKYNDYQLFIGFKKAYDSARREVLYNILIEFGVTMKLVRLNKIF